MEDSARMHDDPIKMINYYLSSIDGVKEYVIVLEGFPIYWSSNLDQEKAEELAALAIDMISSSDKYVPRKEEGYVILGTETPEGYTGAVRLKPNLSLFVRGEPRIVRMVLLNAYRYVHGGFKCPWCGGDLSLHIVKCRNNHSLPVGVGVCPICGSRIDYFKCPHCGKLVDPHGYRVSLKTPRENIVAGIIMGIAGIVSIGIAIPIYNISSIISSILIAASGLFFGLSYSGLKRKLPVRIDNK